MRASDIRQAMSFESPTTSAVFSCVNIVSRYVMEHGPTDKAALDAIIRLRDLVEQDRIESPALKDAIYSLCREAGLFPYLPESELTWRDQIAYEFFRGPTEMDYVFHREQWQAFQHLLSGKSLVLSAPTSFGKSVLIHAFIAQQRPNCVVIVVPTIALLDQFRRKLTDYFGTEYFIVTRNDQIVEPGTRRIYVVTQERLLDRNDVEEIDLLVIDEYYKLDKGRESQGDGSRAALLNVALRRYMNDARQIFFLGPAVAGLEMRDDLREQFVEWNSDFSPVAVDVHKHTESDAPYSTLASLLRQYKSDKSLIFSKSPPAARRLVGELVGKTPLPITASISNFADWLSDNYHPDWMLVDALRAGYGLHHGSVPRSVAQMLVRSFNEGDLRALICTSTLIEGVNTAAKNVFIFDKKISNSNYDYFDFRNIAGRSGRMGHHFIGRIFLFHEPPQATSFQLEIPALGDDASLPDSVLVNIPDESLSRESRERKRALFEQSSLPEDLLKQFSSYGLGSVERLSSAVGERLAAGDQSFLWRGYVRYNELLAVFELAWQHLRFNKGRLSPKEAAFHANRLRTARTLRSYFDGLVDGKGELERSESIEKGFRALVAFDYAVPKVLVDMEALVNYHCEQLGLGDVDYSFMAQSLDNLFNHRWVKALDEYGVPVPLGKKLEFLVQDTYTLDDAIDVVVAFNQQDDANRNLSDVERQIIRAALQ